VRGHVISRSGFELKTLAAENREGLERSGVFAVNIVGAPGCGKTSLIRATLEGIDAGRRVGVIAADPSAHKDADRLEGCAGQVVQVNTGPCHYLDAAQFRHALDRLDLDSLDLLLIENVSSLIGPTEFDLGECKRVAMFSVAAGHDKLMKYAEAVRWADVVVLNKTDLLASFPFCLECFREQVRRVNAQAALFEISTLTKDGIEPWLSWLRWESHHAGSTRAISKR
jgi:hydrogenase nickel incorporation protein HypB